jgi:hypothetical protein
VRDEVGEGKPVDGLLTIESRREIAVSRRGETDIVGGRSAIMAAI